MSDRNVAENELGLLTEIALLRAHGQSWKDIASELDVERARLREITRAHGAVYWRLFEEAQHRASLEAASMARAKLEELLQSENERIALRAAQALLGDQRGKERNSVLRDRNDIFAGKLDKRRKDAESWRQLREAEMTLAEYRRDYERRKQLRDQGEEEPSLWQKAYNKQYGGNGGDGANADLIALARAAFDEMTDANGRLIDPQEARRAREEKNGEAS